MSKTPPTFLGPTKERTQKPDYESYGTGKRKRRVKAKTVQTLHDSGDIGGEEVTASERWLSDYLFSEHGYADYLKEPLPHDCLKGDVHTFAVARGQAGARINEIRENLGFCSHTRLKRLLADGISFSALGAELYPGKSRTDGIAHVRAQCVLLLEQLAHFYVDKKKREAHEKNTCTCQTNMA